MKFINILLLCVLFYMGSTVQSFAQVKTIPPSDTTTSHFLEKNLFKLYFFTPGIGYERKITKKFTIEFSGGIYPFYFLNSDRFGPVPRNEFGVGYSIGIGVNARYYYNFKEREQLNVNTKKNSANYFSISLLYNPIYHYFHTPDDFDEVQHGFVLAATWGLQRSYNRLFINLNLGAKLNITKHTPIVLPVINFSFGYLLFYKL